MVKGSEWSGQRKDIIFFKMELYRGKNDKYLN